MFPSLTRDEVFRIETPRLWLRWPRREDAVALACWAGLPEVATMTSTFGVGITSEEMREKIGAMRAINAGGSGLCFAMVPQGAASEPIGLVGVTRQVANGSLELGYQLAPKYWGRGLMSEAVAALAEQVFELNAASSISAHVRPENPASARVLENCGFKIVGPAMHESLLYGGYPVTRYALARSRPSALRAAQRRFHVDGVLGHELVGFV